jgi:predicted dehydrogenase
VDHVRVGFVGAGRIADLNVLGWLEHPRASIAAVCDVDPAVRERRAREWGCRAYATLAELLADDGVDAVEILTPHHLHAEHAIAAIEAGKHVSLQKPPTTTLADFDRVVAAAARAGTTFRVYENFMFYPPHVAARALVEAGEIGDVCSVRIVTAGGRLGAGAGWEVPAAANAWRMDPALCGGGMMTFDHGFHCFQLARMFVDEPVEVVHAFIHTIDLGDGREIDAPALVTWRHAAPGGSLPRLGSWELVASVDLDVRSDYYVSDDRLEIRGTSGIIWVNRCTGQLLEEPALVHYRDGTVTAHHRIAHDWASSFRAATTAFIDALLDGSTVALDATEARATLAFALAAQHSAAEHREVRVAELG